MRYSKTNKHGLFREVVKLQGPRVECVDRLNQSPNV